MSDDYIFDDLIPATPTRQRRHSAQAYSAAIADGSAAQDYVTPGDPPIPGVGSAIDPDWPDRPIWIDISERGEALPDYNPEPPTFAQRRYCVRLGVICPPTKIEASAWIRRTLKAQRTAARAAIKAAMVRTQRCAS